MGCIICKNSSKKDIIKSETQQTTAQTTKKVIKLSSSTQTEVIGDASTNLFITSQKICLSNTLTKDSGKSPKISEKTKAYTNEESGQENNKNILRFVISQSIISDCEEEENLSDNQKIEGNNPEQTNKKTNLSVNLSFQQDVEKTSAVGKTTTINLIK